MESEHNLIDSSRVNGAYVYGSDRKQIGGYVTDLTKDQLTGAPERASDWQGDRDYETRLHDYYGRAPYWL